MKAGSEVITVDSDAEEWVCPQKWGESFGLKAVGPEGKMRMINVAGDEVSHLEVVKCNSLSLFSRGGDDYATRRSFRFSKRG